MRNKSLKFVFVDIITISMSLFLAFWLRFDFNIPHIVDGIEIRSIMYSLFAPFILVQIGIFILTGLYQRIWRFTSLFDLFSILKSVVISCVIDFLGLIFFIGIEGFPRSVLFLFLLINMVTVCMSRISVRVYFSHYHIDSIFKSNSKQKKLILIGAGRTGEKIAREIINTQMSPFKIVGFVDDDHNKRGQRLHGYKVFGSVDSLNTLNIKFDELIICVPTASSSQIRKIIESCKKTGKPYKTVPTLIELIDKDVSLDLVRDVSYTDLLGRAEIKLDMFSIEKMLNGKRILISGAGGSIGLELVKQCLAFNPSEIICIDINEEKIFDIGYINVKNSSKTILKSVLVDINNNAQLEKVFNENRPQIVFHAAAYKHVPIQELHPWTAVDTNIGGTLNMVTYADKFEIEKFVLVSTDKAVNPVNIMGATKRVAEKIMQSFNVSSKTNYMAVRFGNVLGSSGSAIPIFQNQINNGGPVTITHPEMTRYFMSIQEASQLILQSGSLGKDGEIFLLDMGKPIKISRIARDLIRLSGYEPESDIPIVYTGLRPGEKLYEELQHIGEKRINTEHTKITILKDGKSIIPWNILKYELDSLLKISKSLDSDKVQKKLKKLIPTYQPRAFTSLDDLDDKLPFGIKGQA